MPSSAAPGCPHICYDSAQICPRRLSKRKSSGGSLLLPHGNHSPPRIALSRPHRVQLWLGGSIVGLLRFMAILGAAQYSRQVLIAPLIRGLWRTAEVAGIDLPAAG